MTEIDKLAVQAIEAIQKLVDHNAPWHEKLQALKDKDPGYVLEELECWFD
jgi:hypothetical protein